MIKIRLEGTQEEIIKSVDGLKESFEILSQTTFYKNRGENQYYRLYIEALRKEK